MRPSVHIRLPDGALAVLEHGDLIGRLWSAAVRVDDPRVSEAHAIVSLRGGDFWLLALRRLVAVDGKPVSEVRLAPGVRVELAPGLELLVDSLDLPAEILAIEADGMPTAALPSVCTLHGGARPSLSPGFKPDAPAIWSDGSGWRLRIGDDTRALHPGDTFVCEGTTFRIGLLPLGRSGPGTTRLAGGVHASLRIVTAWDNAQIHRTDEATLVLSGVAARVLCELASCGGSAPWEVIAREIWKDDANDLALRKRWDVALARLRARLRESRIRPDLVYNDGCGTVGLLLLEGDRLEDHS